MNKTQIINLESSTASDFYFPCKPLPGPPPADAAPTKPRGRSGKHYLASAPERNMLEVKMGGRIWGREAFLRPFLQRLRQLGTVPYTVLYFNVVTGKYGVQCGCTP